MNEIGSGMQKFDADILHMASFARSGETVLLRTLAAHPAIKVVHQLMTPDTDEDIRLFHYLLDYEPLTISSSHEKVVHKALQPGQKLLLKNGVWTHPYPFKGFVLVRNPFSVIASLLRYAESHQESIEHQKQRLLRWADRIDPSLLPDIGATDLIEGYARLYVSKMLPLADKGLPILRYEDFVTDSRSSLEALCADLDLRFDESLLRAHEGYPDQMIGHGGCRLWEPISSRSNRSDGGLPRETVDKIRRIAEPALKAYHYGAR